MTDDFITLKNVDFEYEDNCNICDTLIKGFYKIYNKDWDYFIEVQCPFCGNTRRIIYDDYAIKEQYLRRRNSK